MQGSEEFSKFEVILRGNNLVKKKWVWVIIIINTYVFILNTFKSLKWVFKNTAEPLH